jgi:hypothetical protein
MAFQDAAGVSIGLLSATTGNIASGTITNLVSTSATVTNLVATSFTLSNLSINSANITTLTSGSATLTNLTSTSGTVTTLASTSANITTLSGSGTDQDVIYVLKADDIVYHAADQPKFEVFPDTLSASLQCRLRIYSYAALTPNARPEGLARIVGTGLNDTI